MSNKHGRGKGTKTSDESILRARITKLEVTLQHVMDALEYRDPNACEVRLGKKVLSES